MKKLFLTLSILTLFLSLNLNANNDLDKRAMDTAKKTTILDNTWTVYISDPYIVNKSSVMNYKALDSSLNAQKVSVSVWIKKDNTKSALYIFLQSSEGNYADSLLISDVFSPINTKIKSFNATYKDSLGKFKLSSTKEEKELKNVNIISYPNFVTSEKSAIKFITNGTFKKVE